MKLTALEITIMLREKTWALLLVLLAAAALIGPSISDANVNPTIVPTVRSQAVYIVAYLWLFIGVPYVASEISARHRGGFRAWWTSLGYSPTAQLLSLTVATIVWAGASAILAMSVICIVRDPELSVVSVCQALAITVAAAVLVAPLVLVLAQKVSATTAMVVGMIINGVFAFGPSACTAMANNPRMTEQARSIANVFSKSLPDISLGDQAQRITFAWPPMAIHELAQSVAYLVFWLVALGLAANAVFKKQTT